MAASVTRGLTPSDAKRPLSAPSDSVRVSAAHRRFLRSRGLLKGLTPSPFRRHLVIPQHPPEDLPRRALRQLGDEAVLTRALEARERVRGEAMGVELLRGHTLGDDDGDYAVPEAVVGCA